MLKILQARLQQYVNRELPDVLEKAGEPEIKLPTSTGSSKKQESSRKTSISAFWLCQSLWLCGSQETVENSERDGNTRQPDPPLEKPICRSGSNSENWRWNNRLVSNWKRSMPRLYIVTLLIELLCRVHHEKRWAGRSTCWNINNLRYADDTTLMAESEEDLKASWWKWKRRVKKLA